MIRLFDIENNKVIPTEHCYNIKFLKDIMDQYPDNYIKVYSYLFYMTCQNPDLNPFFNLSADIKEDFILKEIDADFSTDDDLIIEGVKKCINMYETPTSRAYVGIQTMLDKLAKYMTDNPITVGRDGNMNSLLKAAKDYDSIRSSFKAAYQDLKEEQQSHFRGGAGMAYDQK
jgi:hypothetical protein